LLTYEQARPWARAIRDAVGKKTMPPWFAESEKGAFADDPRLTAEEIAAIRQWADGGAPRGNDNAPAPREYVSGWGIGTPDAVVEMPAEIAVPARGELDYQHVIVPAGLAEGRWVEAIEVRPSNRRAVHHAVVFVRPPRSRFLRGRPEGEAFAAKGDALAGLSVLDEVLAAYLPGAGPMRLPEGYAKFIPGGSDLVFQIHYTATGSPEKDRTKVGLVFAKQPPRMRIYSLSIAEGKFEIPPLAAVHTVRGGMALHTAVEVHAMAPHMHLRGKAMRLRAVLPDEEEVELLHVPRYDFYWQLRYRPAKPVALPARTRIEMEAVFDNSPGNPRNPDARAAVRWGEQSREEMAVALVEVAIPAGLDPAEIFRAKRF
jgi:hypothetical protein